MLNKRNLIMLIAIIILATTVYINAQQETLLVSPGEVNKMIANDTNIVLLDVRTVSEFNSEAGHLKSAYLIPVDELETRINELDKFKTRSMIVYCRSGHRSGIALPILLKHGFKVRNMEGGINRWNAEQLPVIKEIQ